MTILLGFMLKSLSSSIGIMDKRMSREERIDVRDRLDDVLRIYEKRARSIHKNPAYAGLFLHEFDDAIKLADDLNEILPEELKIRTDRYSRSWTNAQTSLSFDSLFHEYVPLLDMCHHVPRRAHD